MWYVDFNSLFELENIIYIKEINNSPSFGSEIKQSYKNPPGKICGFLFYGTRENQQDTYFSLKEKFLFAISYWESKCLINQIEP